MSARSRHFLGGEQEDLLAKRRAITTSNHTVWKEAEVPVARLATHTGSTRYARPVSTSTLWTSYLLPILSQLT